MRKAYDQYESQRKTSEKQTAACEQSQSNLFGGVRWNNGAPDAPMSPKVLAGQEPAHVIKKNQRSALLSTSQTSLRTYWRMAADACSQ